MTPSKAVVGACQLLRKRVRYERASFALPSVLPGRMSNDADTQAVREATRLYCETWIVPIIDAIEQGDTKFLQEFCRR